LKEKEFELFINICGQLEVFHAEISALSKKKPNDAINKFKLKFINKVLEDANKLLKEKYKPFADFDYFKEDEIPTNSDITMMLSQYLQSMEKLRIDNIFCVDYEWYWKIDNKRSKIKTNHPSKNCKEG
jgi:hypothetical protein